MFLLLICCPFHLSSDLYSIGQGIKAKIFVLFCSRSDGKDSVLVQFRNSINNSWNHSLQMVPFGIGSILFLFFCSLNPRICSHLLKRGHLLSVDKKNYMMVSYKTEIRLWIVVYICKCSSTGSPLLVWQKQFWKVKSNCFTNYSVKGMSVMVFILYFFSLPQYASELLLSRLPVFMSSSVPRWFQNDWLFWLSSGWAKNNG